MRNLDLFSGIGGFSLALDRVWHEEKNEHIFVEWDDFCTAVLKKHWPKAEYHKDIRQFVADTHRARIGTPDGETIPHRAKNSEKRKHAQSESRRHVDLITGGFPCQPFSQAGRRKGTDDDRYLWPAMLECISLFKPRWVIAENVSGLATWNDGLVFETVCSDMEKEGYTVQPFRIPACAVGAPHRRDRWWFVAQDTKRERGSGRMESDGQVLERGESEAKDARPSWEENWIEVAARLCRVDDGVPRRMDRNPRLKALGNAIVPQVAEEIMKAIKYADRLPTFSK